MSRLTNVLAAASVAALAACASTPKPASLSQAEQIYDRLNSSGAPQRVGGDVIHTQQAISIAQSAVSQHQNKEYVEGVSNIALRTAQTAEANDARIMDAAVADSLRTRRLRRLLSLSEAQRAALSNQAQMSAEENAALRQQNVTVTQQADSLRQAAEAANAQLNAALSQLRSLVVEITNLRETTRGLVISLSDILFDVDKANLKPGADQNVRRIAAILKQYPDKQISVEGHTDNTGTAAHNQTLSEQRAASVRAALVAGGVDASLITSKGFGDTAPVASNATAAGKQQNRRVEIVVLGAGSLAGASRPSGSPMPAPGAATDSTRKTPPR